MAALKPPPAGDPPPLLTGATAAGTNDPTFVNPARGAGGALEDIGWPGVTKSVISMRAAESAFFSASFPFFAALFSALVLVSG